MRKGIFTLALLLTLMLGVGTVSATEVPDTTQSTATGVYSTTISFQANGGMGTMANLSVNSNGETKLTANTFSRSGFIFTGWNTKADATGTAYANQADAAALATAANNGQTITLYAQWKLNTPTIKKVKLSNPVTIKVSYKKQKQAAGYEICYGTNKKFKKAKKVTAKKGTSSKEAVVTTTGKTYYVRMRSYHLAGGKKIFSDWSKSSKIKVRKAYTIANTKSDVAMEADITLTGSGTGYHAKLVLCTPTSAVSYGLQYDACAVAPYTGKTMALIENIASNNAGGQSYSRPGNKALKLGKSYHLMITLNKNGSGNVYLDYKKIGSFKNSKLAKQDITLRLEGCARLNGDKVKAVFKNVKCKKGTKYDPNKLWSPYEIQTCKTIDAKVKKNGTVTISGRVSGLPAGGDWDSCYESVSDIIQLVP